jgi:hypothetical protein
MSYQRANAQNKARSYNSSRKHKRPPRSKSIKEDEHMHSQKKIGDQARFDRDQMRIGHTDLSATPGTPCRGEIGPDLFRAAIWITSS